MLDEGYEQEFYEPPDYEVWETNRVYEDMDIERREAEAEALAEVEDAERQALYAIVMGAVEYRTYDPEPPLWGDVVADVVEALRAARVSVPAAE